MYFAERGIDHGYMVATGIYAKMLMGADNARHIFMLCQNLTHFSIFNQFLILLEDKNCYYNYFEHGDTELPCDKTSLIVWLQC